MKSDTHTQDKFEFFKSYAQSCKLSEPKSSQSKFSLGNPLEQIVLDEDVLSNGKCQAGSYVQYTPESLPYTDKSNTNSSMTSKLRGVDAMISSLDDDQCYTKASHLTE